MFTGIIETLGTLEELRQDGSNVELWLSSALTAELKIDQSLAHNGVCLTVVEIKGDRYRVTAVDETVKKTNLSVWKPGDRVNLERALRLGDRLDGHFVQGHVDGVIECLRVEERDGSWLYEFSLPEAGRPLVIEKGSVCLNGVSLTAFGVERDRFRVTIIPYTHTHTQFPAILPGSLVNIEYDVLGKYFLRNASLQKG